MASTVAEIPLGGKDNSIDLRSVTLGCSSLFVEETAADTSKTYKLLSNKTQILHLKALSPLRTTGDSFEFLPTKVYVRTCMQEIFEEIVKADDPKKYAVVFGSPGVGKSVLSFLAALCYACYKKKPVLFLRKTTKKMEHISVFWITPGSNDDGKSVNVDFARDVTNKNALQLIHDEMINHIFKDDIDHKKKARTPWPYLRSFCDGPRHDHVDHVPGSDLVTSGGYKLPADEAWDDITALPLSAWTQKEVILGCRYLFKVKAIDAKRIFDICGGNIRAITLCVVNGVDSSIKKRRKYIDGVVKNEGKQESLVLALESTALSSTPDSIDRLRTMFATPDEAGYATVQYIGSPYLLRLIRSRLPLGETLRGLRSAKKSGIQSLYGWHFELFGHKVFQVSHERQAGTMQKDNVQAPPTCHTFGIVEGSGTGKESVKQLKKNGLYWTPSTSNFANIDAAIALNGILFCIQYTVSVSHTFNYQTFVSEFLEQLPSEFRSTISKVIVVFVVPQEVIFRSVVIPKSQMNLTSGITCGDGIDVVYRKAGSAVEDKADDDKTENPADAKPDEDDENMEEPAGAQPDEDDDKMEEDVDEIFSDDDCGEEGFDEEETSPLQGAPPAVHFQWESLSEEFDPENAPLSFLNL